MHCDDSCDCQANDTIGFVRQTGTAARCSLMRTDTPHAPAELPGRFGDGMKVGLCAIVADGFDVKVETNAQSWRFGAGRGSIPQLVVKVVSKPKRTETAAKRATVGWDSARDTVFRIISAGRKQARGGLAWGLERPVWVSSIRWHPLLCACPP